MQVFGAILHKFSPPTDIKTAVQGQWDAAGKTERFALASWNGADGVFSYQSDFDEMI